jgi:ribosome-associated heat shock protein Hsp15
MRIDKYIWAIRLFKTRSLASKACMNEKVKLNGDFIKSSKIVKQNDIIALKLVPIWKVFKIIDLPKTRVGAKLVGDFSKEITSDEDLEVLNQYESINRQNRNIGIKGRPTKKDRRNLGDWLK